MGGGYLCANPVQIKAQAYEEGQNIIKLATFFLKTK